MRKLIVITATAGSLVLAASALAVLPSQRASFSGVTSERAINGYKPTVMFRIGLDGRTLRGFVFQTLGCFGSGAFPVGVDPFAETPWRVTKIPFSTAGAFTVKARPTSTTPGAGTMSATISGAFSGAKKVTGKIVFFQVQAGADCGPQTVKFTATS